MVVQIVTIPPTILVYSYETFTTLKPACKEVAKLAKEAYKELKTLRDRPAYGCRDEEALARLRQVSQRHSYFRE